MRRGEERLEPVVADDLRQPAGDSGEEVGDLDSRIVP
jgi:hypothetical protein